MGDGGIHLLLVEDNPGDARLVRELLRGANGISIDAVDRLSAAKARLSGPGIDIVLLDLGLPDSQGLETLARVRTHLPALPVIVLTGLDDETLALEAVKAGAQDYLVKGRFDEDSLPRAIRYATERQKAEAALRESEARYRTLFNDMPVGIYRTGEDGRILDANPALAELLGYDSPAELVGLDSGDLYVEPEDQVRWRQAIEKEGVVHDAEIRLRRKDGRLIWAHDSGRMVRDPFGPLMHFEGTLSDVTERKRTEEQLRLDYEIMSNIVDGVYVIRASDGVILYANRQFEEMFGYNPGELIGQNVSIVNAPAEKTPQETAQAIIAELNRHGIWRGEVLNSRKDGSAFWCDASVTSLTVERADYGVVWISVHRDITERKRAEAQSTEQLDELRRWHKATLGRETRILDLKREVNEFLAQTGQPPRYPSAEPENP